MHCPECGFANAEGANYCQKCGAFLAESEKKEGDTTEVYQVGRPGRSSPWTSRRSRARVRPW